MSYRRPGSAWILAFVAFGLALSLFAGAPAAAQNGAPATPPGVEVSDLEALVSTIEDEGKRQELLTQLRGLIAAARSNEAPPQPEGFGSRLITTLSGTASEASRQIVTAADRLSDLPVFWAWLKRQAVDSVARDAWIRSLAELGLVIAIGLIAEFLVRRLLARPRRRLEAREPVGLWLRIPLVVGRTILDFLPLAVFAVVAYGVLPFIDPGPRTQVLAVTFLQAYLLARGVVVVFRMLLMPAAPALRVLPLGGETANYLFIWVRRLISVWVIGYYIAQGAFVLGLPAGGRNGLLRVAGLLVTAMIVVFVLQNRTAVSQWLRDALGRGTGMASRSRSLRWLADVWHVLAIVYVVGVFAVWALDVEGGFEYLIRSTVVSAAILLVAKALSMVLRRGVERAFSVREDIRARFPLLEARANRYVPLIHVALRAVLFVVVALALLQTWGIDALGGINSPVGRRITGSAFSIGFVVILALILWEAVSTAIERYLNRTNGDGTVVERSARARTLLPLLRNAIMVLLVVMVTLIVLSELGINIGPLLAGAGVVGLAIGFGSQKMVQDVINGAFILFEDSISVGDVVTAGGISGVVERLSIRSIRLRDLTGNVHTIPFSSVDTVTNMTKEFSMAVIEAGVAYRENVDEVMEVLKQLGAEMKEDPEFGPLIREPLEMLGVDALADSAVIIKCRFKVQPIKQWTVQREFNRRMKNRFDELGIEIPFPHQTVYFGADKDGTAPPAFVRTEPAKPRRKITAAKAEEDSPAPAAAEAGVDLPSAD